MRATPTTWRAACTWPSWRPGTAPDRGQPAVMQSAHSDPFQVAGDRARQLQKVGASADDLQLVIARITEIVRALVPGVPDADAEEGAALPAM
jgi:hypothetical protein